MIYLAVLAASLTVFGVGVWIGWAARADVDRDPYDRGHRQGYKDALTAAGWLYADQMVD